MYMILLIVNEFFSEQKDMLDFNERELDIEIELAKLLRWSSSSFCDLLRLECFLSLFWLSDYLKNTNSQYSF